MSAQGKLRKCQDGILMWHCPGCKCGHGVNSGWVFNGDYSAPTFNPSVLVRGAEMTDKGQRDYEAWMASGDLQRGESFESKPSVCHCFIQNGQIMFLADCTHEFAGKTVPMEDAE